MKIFLFHQMLYFTFNQHNQRRFLYKLLTENTNSFCQSKSRSERKKNYTKDYN